VKTPVTDYLDRHKVPYRLKIHRRPALTVEEAARERGVTPAGIVKTLILVDENGNMSAAVLPGDRRLDLKKLAGTAGKRKLRLAGREAVEKATGQVIGALAPLGPGFDRIPLFADPAVFELERADLSSGDPGAGVEIAGDDLRRLLGRAVTADLSQE
jgi:Ala-tRNA(Pro) deacylase